MHRLLGLIAGEERVECGSKGQERCCSLVSCVSRRQASFACDVMSLPYSTFYRAMLIEPRYGDTETDKEYVSSRSDSPFGLHLMV
jgi:hypothetical protein